jgi:uncharacterized protein (TIGR02722 family)
MQKKRVFPIVPMLGSLVLLALLVSCQSVKRVDAGTQTDLSGDWNDTDLRLASEALIAECINHPRLRTFEDDWGRLPVIITGSFKNTTDEHIDTSILSDKMEMAIMNNGRAEVVASGDLRKQIRGERDDQQQGYTSDDTVAALGKEVGADFMMTGTFKSMEDSSGNKTARKYFVTARLTSITSSLQIWSGEYEIKKVIKNSRVKL